MVIIIVYDPFIILKKSIEDQPRIKFCGEIFQSKCLMVTISLSISPYRDRISRLLVSTKVAKTCAHSRMFVLENLWIFQ